MNYIEQKQLFFEEILENTRAQTLAIKEDNLNKLETLIVKREDIMKQVDKLDKGSATAISNISPDDLQPIKDLLTQIIQEDNANQSLMQKEFEQVKSELRKIRLAKQREEAYGNEYGLHKEEGLLFDTK